MFAKKQTVNRNALNSCIHNLALAWFCCEKTLRGVSETVETCSAKGLKHLSCQSERVFDTCKNGPASFMTTAGYLSKKSILCELAEDLLVFQMCRSEQRPPLEHREQITRRTGFRGVKTGVVCRIAMGRVGGLQLGTEWRNAEKQNQSNVSKHLTELCLWHLACDESFDTVLSRLLFFAYQCFYSVIHYRSIPVVS